jgi:hypothetical protein
MLVGNTRDVDKIPTYRMDERPEEVASLALFFVSRRLHSSLAWIILWTAVSCICMDDTWT